jgi:hypothetical protein
MLSKTELVSKILSQLETNRLKEAAAGLAEGFNLSGPAPRPLNKSEFLELMEGLVSAIPDWRFNMTDAKETRDGLQIKLHISGTNSRPINIPLLGIRSVHSTGKRVALPEEPVEVKIVENKIVVFNVSPVAGGGIQGLFKQLGVELPVPTKA